jgi:hypothetical protein
MAKGNMEDRQARQNPQGFLIKWRVIAAFVAAAVVAFIVPAAGFGEDGEVVKQSLPLTVAAVSGSIVYTPNIADTLDSCFVVSGLPEDESAAAFNARIVYYNAGEDGSLDIERLSPPDRPGRYWAAAATDETDNFLPVVSAPIPFEIAALAAGFPDGTAEEGMLPDAGRIPADAGEAANSSSSMPSTLGGIPADAGSGTLVLGSADKDPQDAEDPALAEGASGDSEALVAAAADISPLAFVPGPVTLSLSDKLQMKVPDDSDANPADNNITIGVGVNNSGWGWPQPATIYGAQMTIEMKIDGVSKDISAWAEYFDLDHSTIYIGTQGPYPLTGWLANTNNTFTAGTLTVNLKPWPAAAGRTFEYTVKIVDSTWPYLYGMIASAAGKLRVKNGVALTGNDNLHMVVSGSPNDGRNDVKFKVSLAHKDGILADVRAGFVLYDEDEGRHVDWTTYFSADYSTIAINGGSPEKLSDWLSHGSAGFSDGDTLTINLVPLASARGKTFSYRLDLYDNLIPSPNRIARAEYKLHVLAAEYAFPNNEAYLSDRTRALLTKVYGDAPPPDAEAQTAILGDLKAFFRSVYPSGSNLEAFLGSLRLQASLPASSGYRDVGLHPYDISVSSTDARYTITGSVSASLDVTKRPVVLTVRDASKYQGEADPMLSWSSDLPSWLASTLAGVNVTRTPGESVGSYSINAAWTANQNLAVTAGRGTFTIYRASKNGEYQRQLRPSLYSGSGGSWYSPLGGTLYPASGPNLSSSYSAPAPAGPAATAAAVNTARPSSAQTAPVSSSTPAAASSPTTSSSASARAGASPEEEPAAPDSYRSGVAEPSVNRTAAIEKTAEPGTTPSAAGWSFVNLVFLILSCALMALLAALFLRRDSGAADAAERRRRNFQFWTISIIVAAAAICLFALTENLSMPMTLFNRWTVLHGVILALEIVLFSFAGSESRGRAADVNG